MRACRANGSSNSITREKGECHVDARHGNADFGRWNLELQGVRYAFDPDNPPGPDDDLAQPGAFDFPFPMAARAFVHAAKLARSSSASPRPIPAGTCYDEFSVIDPKVDHSADSIRNVIGGSIIAGGYGTGRNATTAGKWR